MGIISVIYALQTQEMPKSNQQIAMKYAERIKAPEGTNCPDFIVPMVLALATVAGRTTCKIPKLAKSPVC